MFECHRFNIVVLTLPRYNAMSHPLPFMKASNVTVTKKAGKEMPDLEEAIEEEDDDAAPDAAEVVDEEDELDLKKDKYIKQPKAKSAKKAAPKKATKAKGKAVDDDDDDEDEAPAKGKGKATKGRGKAKK
jgi:replication factor C subunit 1